jgi:hypothetical protein
VHARYLSLAAHLLTILLCVLWVRAGWGRAYTSF